MFHGILAFFAVVENSTARQLLPLAPIEETTPITDVKPIADLVVGTSHRCTIYSNKHTREINARTPSLLLYT